MIGITFLFVFMIYDGSLTRWEGGVLFLLFIAYIVFSLRMARREKMEEPDQKPQPFWLSFLFLILGLGGLVYGAEFFLGGAVEIAKSLGVSEAVIGASVVAIGTSLPELATSAVAALRKQGDMALGNVLGSNIFNILSIAGITALIKPFTFPALTLIDMGALLLFTLLVFPFARSGFVLTRFEGALLIAGYAAYLAVIFSL